MNDYALMPARVPKLVQARMDFGVPYFKNAAPETYPLFTPAAEPFAAPAPLTGGYDSYAEWTKPKKQKLCHIMEIDNGFADKKGNVFDEKGCRIELASHKSKYNPSLAGIERNAWKSVKPIGIKPTVSFDGEVFVVTSSTAKLYYHGLLEIVPRLAMVQKLDPDQRSPIYVDASQPFMRECLKALNIENIIDASIFPRIQAQKMVVPCYEIGAEDSVPKRSIDLLNSMFPDRSSANSNVSRRFYLPRRNAVRRKIINENEINAILAKNGFETVFPEQLTIQEQANLFRQAAMVAGASGGAFTNIVFCRPGTTVLNFFHWQADNSIYKLCSATGARYAYVATRPTAMERLQAYFRKIEIGERDIVIDSSDCTKTLELLNYETSRP
jgi:hypothetical protein